MKINRKYYTEIVAEELEPYYNEKKHGSFEHFVEIISESISKTIEFYEDTYDFEDEEFDLDVFNSDVLNDAKRAVEL